MVLTVLAIVVAATFVVTGGVKLFGVPASLAIRDSLDIPATQWRLIGVMEWLGAAGVLLGLTYRPLGLVAAIGLAALLVGAMITRVRAARRHDRSEAGGVAVDVLTFALAASTAAVFAMNL
jgi:uncharacterized membrane protein YphA (DoxX/SURF4 family)